jgi:uncharacterized protein (DUF433 family)
MNLAQTSTPPPLHEDADGVIRVGGTRVTLQSIIALFDQGAGPEEIALRFPVLKLADVYETISFYLRHQTELQPYLQAQEQASDIAREQAAQRLSTTKLRRRLMKRKEAGC